MLDMQLPGLMYFLNHIVSIFFRSLAINAFVFSMITAFAFTIFKCVSKLLNVSHEVPRFL